MKVVDDHAHIHIESFFPDQPAYWPEFLIKTMDEDGVDISLVSDACFSFANTGSDYMEGNDHCYEALREYPDRLKGIAILNPYARGIEAMEAEADRTWDLGFVGFKMHPTCHHHPANDPWGVFPAVEKAIEHDVPIWIHTGEGPYASPMLVVDLARRYPEARIVLGHRGHTLFPVMTYFVRNLPNVWVDLSFLAKWELPYIQLREVGTERFLFGSDHPIIRPRIMLETIRGSTLSEEEKTRILGGNAEQLYGLS